MSQVEVFCVMSRRIVRLLRLFLGVVVCIDLDREITCLMRMMKTKKLLVVVEIEVV